MTTPAIVPVDKPQSHLAYIAITSPSIIYLCMIQSGAAGAGLPPPAFDNICGGASGVWSAGSGWVIRGPEPHGLCPTCACRGAGG